MFTKTILSATALLAGVATAGSAPGFPIDVTQNLTVTYSNNTVSPGGERIPRPGTFHPLSSRRSRAEYCYTPTNTHHHQKPQHPQPSRRQYGFPTSEAPANASSSWSTSTCPVTTHASN